MAHFPRIENANRLYTVLLSFVDQWTIHEHHQSDWVFRALDQENVTIIRYKDDVIFQQLIKVILNISGSNLILS